jgi:hypothetical protein
VTNTRLCLDVRQSIHALGTLASPAPIAPARRGRNRVVTSTGIPASIVLISRHSEPDKLNCYLKMNPIYLVAQHYIFLKLTRCMMIRIIMRRRPSIPRFVTARRRV